ncbi:MAG TPA: amino acid racemase, partial [Bacteroidia bacterium]|nr:amino acid racemase [Bacteroidia bacterium]
SYGEIKKNNDREDWQASLKLFKAACLNMKDAGVEGVILCANTMHVIARELEEQTGMPLIHIATATAAEIEKQKLRKVALIGTRFTMQKDFFKERLRDRGIETIIPNPEEQDYLHHTIFEEFGRDIFRPETKKKYLELMGELASRGAEGIILGCTEIPMLLGQKDFALPLFDTTRIHARAAVDFALS